MCAPFHPHLREALLAALADAEADRARVVLITESDALGTHLVRQHAKRVGVSLVPRVSTWRDLALELTAPERSATQRRVLTREARTWLLRRLREKSHRAPNLYDPLLDMRGFRTTLLRTFDDLARAGLASAAQVETFLLRHAEALRLPVRHALELDLAYRRSFESMHDDIHGLLSAAARVPPGRFEDRFGSRRLWLYGTNSLSRLQRSVLENLGRDSQLELRFYVPDAATPRNFFASLGCEVEVRTEGIRLPEDVRVLASPSEESEAAEIARQILRAVDDGIPLSRMAVVARSARRLAPVRSTLRRHAIPYSNAAGRSLQSSRGGRALLQLFTVLERGLEPEPALDFFAAAPMRWREWANLDADPVTSAWERAARAVHLGHGIADWKRKLVARDEEMSARAGELDRDNEPAQRARAAAAAARDLLRAGEALHDVVRSFLQRGSWADFVAATTQLVETLFEPGPETEALCTAVERLRALDAFGRPETTREDFRDTLRHLLAETHVPETGGGVVLGAAASLYGIDFECVFVAGLQEGEWPGVATEDPVLPDLAREQIAALLEDATALPDRDAGPEAERRQFWATAGAASRRLVLSYARLDPISGASRLPAALLLELAQRREGRSVDYAQFEQLGWVERVPLQRSQLTESDTMLGSEEFDLRVALGMPRRAARRYVRRLGDSARRGLEMEILRNQRARFTAVDGNVRTPAALRWLAARLSGRAYSATQLATYATCPFRYFLRHLLRVEPIDREEMREPPDLEIGKLLHRILERFHAEVQRRTLAGESPAGEELRRCLLEAAATAFEEVEKRGQSGARLLWEIRQQRLREDLLHYLRLETKRAPGGWIPEAFELRFGPGTALVAEVRAGGRSIPLQGFIDRLDRHTAHDGRRVIDYKSGKIVREGPQALQLVLYLLAVTRDGSVSAQSEGRFVYVTRRGDHAVQRLPGIVLVERKADVEGWIAAVVHGIETGQFFPQPGSGGVRCKSCDYISVCDVRVTAQADLKARAGQVKWLDALPDFATCLETPGSEAEAAP